MGLNNHHEHGLEDLLHTHKYVCVCVRTFNCGSFMSTIVNHQLYYNLQWYRIQKDSAQKLILNQLFETPFSSSQYLEFVIDRSTLVS
jgi:hypothetical protein